MFKRAPGLVLGFHGCDAATAEAIHSGGEPHLNGSANEYDWLGNGIYFWEADPWRAWDFAQEAKQNRHLTRGRINTPCVIGAVIDLGLCFNLLSLAALSELQGAYQYLRAVAKVTDQRLPVNRGREMGLRFLDKAVLETAHSLRARRRLPPYDTVRAAFVEGQPLYKGAGFSSHNHIQIAVRDPARILGYFRVPGVG